MTDDLRGNFLSKDIFLGALETKKKIINGRTGEGNAIIIRWQEAEKFELIVKNIRCAHSTRRRAPRLIYFILSIQF